MTAEMILFKFDFENTRPVIRWYASHGDARIFNRADILQRIDALLNRFRALGLVRQQLPLLAVARAFDLILIDALTLPRDRRALNTPWLL